MRNLTELRTPLCTIGVGRLWLLTHPTPRAPAGFGTWNQDSVSNRPVSKPRHNKPHILVIKYVHWDSAVWVD